MNDEPATTDVPKDADPVTHQGLERLLAEEREKAERIAHKILDQGIERLEREQERKGSAERLKRSDDWLNRCTWAMIGFVIGMVFVLSMSECTHLNSRLSGLESKQH